MDLSNKFWWFAAVSILISAAILTGMAVFFWHQLPAEEKRLLLSLLKEHFIYLFIGIVLLLACIGFGLDAIFNSYILPLNKLAEEVELMHSVNPSRRIRREGSALICHLIDALNEAARRHEQLQANVGTQIDTAKAEVDRERSILAGIMAQLPEGILICNPEGSILFYNDQARRQFSAVQGNGSNWKPDQALVGLGRSVYDLLNRSLLDFALEDLKEKLERHASPAGSQFTTGAGTGSYLRVEVFPVLNQQNHFNGYILIFHDITDLLEMDRSANNLLPSLTRGIRNSLSGIRTASEALISYPEASHDRVIEFSRMIHEESLKIGHMLSRYSLAYPEGPVYTWPRTSLTARSLLEKIRLRCHQMLDIKLAVTPADSDLAVAVDSYSLVLAVVLMFGLLIESHKAEAFGCRLIRWQGYVALDLTWQGKLLAMSTLRQWGTKALTFESRDNPMTLQDVLQYHNGDMWPIRDKEDPGRVGIRIILPDIAQKQTKDQRDLAIVPDSRPEFYDFDLFHQPGQIPELDQTPLQHLTFTVFDTETTGLNPRAGDEIISIGAVRIVNNRLLKEERFEQLVKPSRRLSWESIQIHGIVDEVLKDQPTIDQVLPHFQRFAQGTVLVAHNAAFDMRMLQLMEPKTGVRFENPVLDTMLLSAVIQPSHENHNLTAIARRFGVDITGRHTAIGDALATGEILLKLIPLLEKKGINTLQAAREASQKTYYARLKY